MDGFSFSQAFDAGFRIIRRDPMAVIAWAIAYLVVGVLPIAAAMALAIPNVIEAAKHAGDAATAASPFGPPELMRAQGSMGLVQAASFISGTVVRAMMAGAVFRAVLEPENRGFFYLRLGMQELWLGLLYLAIGILFAMALVAMLLPFTIVIIVVAIAAQGSGSAVPIAIGVLAALAASGVAIWWAVRLSLAGPMTFEERQFRLFESWTLTRGYGGSLFLLALALGLFVLIVSGLVMAVLGLILFATLGASAAGPNPFAALAARPMAQLLPELITGVLAVVLVMSLVGAAVNAILLAPWAEVYRELKTEGEPGVA